MHGDLTPEVKALLSRANPAVISTVTPKGQPVSVATWYLLVGDEVLVNMDEGRKRLEWLEMDPRVALTVLDADDWHRHVSIRGRVVRMVPDEGLADIDRLSQHYVGTPYNQRARARVSAWIRVDGWHVWPPLDNA